MKLEPVHDVTATSVLGGTMNATSIACVDPQNKMRFIRNTKPKRDYVWNEILL